MDFMNRSTEHPIVCLCGSTKFKEEFMTVARQLTLRGFIVVMPHVWCHSGDSVSIAEKTKLDDLHKAKIKMADKIFVINPNDYIGESTKSEIEYAENLGKTIWYYNQIAWGKGE